MSNPTFLHPQDTWKHWGSRVYLCLISETTKQYLGLLSWEWSGKPFFVLYVAVFHIEIFWLALLASYYLWLPPTLSLTAPQRSLGGRRQFATHSSSGFEGSRLRSSKVMFSKYHQTSVRSSDAHEIQGWGSRPGRMLVAWWCPTTRHSGGYSSACAIIGVGGSSGWAVTAISSSFSLYVRLFSLEAHEALRLFSMEQDRMERQSLVWSKRLILPPLSSLHMSLFHLAWSKRPLPPQSSVQCMEAVWRAEISQMQGLGRWLPGSKSVSNCVSGILLPKTICACFRVWTFSQVLVEKAAL